MSDFAITRPEPKLSRESALLQVQKILQFYDYDLAKQSSKTKEYLEDALELITEGFQREALELPEGEKFVIRQNLKNSPRLTDKTITYTEWQGELKVWANGLTTTNSISKMYSLLGRMSGNTEDYFTAMGRKDQELADALGLFFLSF